MEWLVILIVAETLVQQKELLSDNGKVKRGRRIEIHLEGGKWQI
jgi:hypothetical protein